MKGRKKRRERPQELREATGKRIMAEQADNTIEQHRFDKLIKEGIIREIRE